MARDPNTVTINLPQFSTTGDIASTRHPDWDLEYTSWVKWRKSYAGGAPFIEAYMRKLSNRETDDDFTDRKEIAYCPAFAAASITDVKNAIFQRVPDVARVKGPNSYREAVTGLSGGVDFESSTMGTFIGTQVIDELLVQRKVGVLVDNFNDLGVTDADKEGKRPFLTHYIAENILSWAPNNPVNGFTSLLLQETIITEDQYGLANGVEQQYRLMQKVNGGVRVIFFDADSKETHNVVLNIPEIPFALFEIKESLMKNVADYQIALLNLESSDISFARKANYPFYYEFYDSRVDPPHQKHTAAPDGTGTAAETHVPRDKEISVGMTQGKRFPKGMDPPGFINPDPETLRVSMEKGKQLKEDIRTLINLNLIALNPRRQSADSKAADSTSLEASLSYIGLVLQRGEQQIANYWAMFEGRERPAEITYPKTYSLKSEEDRRAEATELDELADKVPSDTFRRRMKIKVAKTVLGAEVTEREMVTIESEILSSPVLTSDPDVILSSQAAGLVDDITASKAIGFNGEDTVKQAKKDRAERVALTVIAQGEASQARGAIEFDNGEASSSEEKDGKTKRGEGSKINKEGDD